MSTTVQEMQLRLTEMLKDFHDVCSKHNLTHYALCGTADRARMIIIAGSHSKKRAYV